MNDPIVALRARLASLREPDERSRSAVQARAGDILRPAGALARLDEIAGWVAAWQGSATPAVRSPAAIICAADHGVAAAGVSAYPTEVTGAMVGAFTRGVSTINAMARVAGATVDVIDVGVGAPTGDIRSEPALSPDRFARAFDAGVAATERLDTDLLVVGEMGIGNTTAAAAVCAVVFGGDPASWVGRGTGVDDDGLERKIAAVEAAVARIGPVDDPLLAYIEVGGAEFAAIAGVVLRARELGVPVLLDGYIVGAAVAPLAAAAPGSLDHCLIGHRSPEPGHSMLIERLGHDPLLALDMRLGEASGAMAAVPLVAMACAAVVEVPTFAEFFDTPPS